MSKARSADEAEDAVHGPDARGDQLPEKLSRRQSRLAKLQESKKALEEAAQAAAQAEEERRRVEEEARREAGESPRTRKPVDPAPAPKAQRNFTDPESKIMKGTNKGFDQCGNAQAVANEGPIFGQIEQVRGVRQFLLRGLEKMRAEWRLICLTHNLLKRFRSQ
jgi:hypothetical protein